MVRLILVNLLFLKYQMCSFKKNIMRIFIGLLFILLYSCEKQTKVDHKRGFVAEQAMVVSAREEASEIGLEVLKQGGNAFDAMVATELALAVAYPFAGNIGGGGFMVYRTYEGDNGALDYREKAPIAATPNLYLDEHNEVIQGKSQLGASAVGVPGTIAGIFAVHEKFGSMPIEALFKPAINLAQKGFVITENQYRSLAQARDLIVKVSGTNTLFSTQFQVGDTLKNKAFAQTLTAIQANGQKEFYKGKTAQRMVDFLRSNGGIITLKDLQQYEVKWRKPIEIEYKDLTVISMSPPSSGGVCLGQMLKMIESYNLKEFDHNSLKGIQLLVEASRRSYADRSFYLGDPDFVAIPLDTLLNEDYLLQRMADFSFEKATPSSKIQHGSFQMQQESNETTHYSIVDAFGNAVAVTTTLNGAYGSKLYSEELGFFFNNQMDDFSAKPGEPNMFGLIGAEANSIQPEKRMLSSMTPTIVEKNDELWMVVGTPGGSRIITTVLQAILNVYEFDMSMQEAADAPRFHHQWLPDEVFFEADFDTDLMEKLKQKGYSISQKEAVILGSINAILVLADGKLEAGADQRRDNSAKGY